jgi:uncharacterized protein YkwD
MDGTRGKALAGWVSVAVLVTPISAARAADLAETPVLPADPVARAAEVAAYKAVFSTDCPGADVLPSRETRTRARLATACLLNRVRHAAGLRTVATVRPLRRIAAQKSRDMVTRRYFSHTAPDRETLMTRLRSVGWRGSAGENIGYGTAYYSTPRAMVWAWMLSSGHRENILEPSYRWIGVAIALGSPTGATGPAATYTTDFGGPA